MSHSGIDTSEFSTTIQATEDLFGFANQPWLERTPIAADRASAGSFLDLRDDAEAAVRMIIESAAQDSSGNPNAPKIAALYSSFMDEAAAQEKGLAPIAETLDRVKSTESVQDLLTLVAQLQRSEVDGLIGFYVANDPGDPQRYLLQLVQNGLGLPDESYYRDEQFAQTREKYQAHVARMLALAGVEDPHGAAERVLTLESSLAAAHWDKVTMRDPQKTYNLLSLSSALDLCPPLELWLDGLGVGDAARAEMVIATPDFFGALPKLLEDFALRSWQEWLIMRVISSAAPYLSADAVAANFDFYGTELSGAEENKPRWKRGVAFVEGAMGEAVGQLYVAEHFPPENKERMERLVGNLIAAYQDSIESLDWMSAETKTKAQEKLAKFTPKIGYPDRWRDYAGLEVTSNDLLGNARAAAAFELDYELAKIGAPIDRDEWLMTPQTVNAYYYPLMNEIVFPAAILQPPFFDPARDDAANYGGIGAVIGHEIGHGFDDKGSQFDGDGALRNWWTADDQRAFDERTSKLVAQYNALSPVAAPQGHVNGELTLGENIGDLGGLGIAYKAWTFALDGAEPATLDGLTGAQRFFYSWALCWRGKNRPQEAVRRLTVDPHSPNEWRCNQVVKNLDEFHTTFSTTEQDAMWLAPSERVRIW